jgi:membrane protein YdbS with pleckstrin-like domain
MTKTKLHPGAKWQFRIGGYIFGLFLIIFIGSLLGGLLTALTESPGIGFTISFLFIIIAVVVMVEIIVNMAYNRWFYEFTKDGLKIERGIIWKKYSNIPYERIQNVDVTRGIIARIFGFSTLNIQTAGYGGMMYRRGFGGMAQSEGYIPAVGVKDAEKIRDFLMKKITGKKTGGL